MRIPYLVRALLVTAVAAPRDVGAQVNVPPKHPVDLGGALILNAEATEPKPGRVSPFWQPTAPLEMTLTLNFKRVSETCLGRTTIAFGSCQEKLDKAPWVPAAVTYAEKGATVTVAARVRARGVSRLRLCDLTPPLWVDFKGITTQRHLFDGVNRFKLVMPCKAAPEFERYTIEEFNLYRLHSLMTPFSHLTRMIRLTVVDSASNTTEFTRYAFAVEAIDELAARLGGKNITTTANPDGLQLYQAALVGVLQYMIGNTDFSISEPHNVELVQARGNVYPVANDFDQAGVIAAPYAAPDSRLGIKSVTQRLYRGVCVPADTIARVLADLREKRAAISALYSDDIGKLIGGNGARESVKWFDEFYSTTANPPVVKRELLDKCLTR